jgi:oligoribonuclease NrnB/cAMP/cGMP phosphodiesterase (DHH superfamily)
MIGGDGGMPKPPRPLCIYHAGCVDGFAAAWVVRRFFRSRGEVIDFVAVQYGEASPDVAGRDVIMVDFSFKRPEINRMIGRDGGARSILILDHHKTAEQELAGFRRPEDTWDNHLDSVFRDCVENIPEPSVYALFDMERSGAGLAWDWFFPAVARPRLIQHVEDRDLWRFRLSETRDLHACLSSHPYDFEVWDELHRRSRHQDGLAALAREGSAIDRKLQKDIAAILATPPRRMVIGGISVPVVNAPGIWASDLAGQLAETEPFAAVYFDMPHARVFSLRSRGEGGADVQEIAKRYGGGGHRNAAGFQAALGWEGDAP